MNKVTQSEFINWCNKLYSELSVYVFGATCQTITKDSMDELYNRYSSDTYNKNYYDMKLKNGRGKIAADAPGMFYKLSGEDRTVREYFSKCIIKGVIAALPKDKVCLLFNNNLTHIGAYLGNGITIEMRGSKVNMVRENFKQARWCYYGIPDFVDYEKDIETLKEEVSKFDVIISKYQEWINKVYPSAFITVDGVYKEKTKENTIRLIQYIFNTYYGKKIGITGVYDDETRKACPSFDVMKSNQEAFKMLTYIVHVYLYANCGYMLDNIIHGENVSTTYTNYSIAYVGMYQQNVRGLELDGKAGSAVFYQMFK